MSTIVETVPRCGSNRAPAPNCSLREAGGAPPRSARSLRSGKRGDVAQRGGNPIRFASPVADSPAGECASHGQLRRRDFGFSAGGAVAPPFCGFSLRGFVRRRPPPAGFAKSRTSAASPHADNSGRNPETPESRQSWLCRLHRPAGLRGWFPPKSGPLDNRTKGRKDNRSRPGCLQRAGRSDRAAPIPFGEWGTTFCPDVLAYKCPFRASYLHVFARRAASRPAGGGLLSFRRPAVARGKSASAE